MPVARAGGRVRIPVVRRVASVGAVAAVLCASAVLPVPAALAAGPGSGYDFADGARRVDGADGTADAERLVPGTTYRSSLPSGGKVHYRLELDDVTSTYVSATAVPRVGSTVASVDGIKVAVQDTEGRSCSFDTAGFGAARSPHPIAAWGMREISPGKALCQEAGTYYVSVERVEPADTSPGTWELELTVASEPRPAKAGATSPPGAWDSASPEPVDGRAERRPGGAGFETAAPVGQGVWRADIAPGGTLFYKVPVDWGQQLSATAELGGANGGGGYAVSALDLSLYNPARGQVQNTSVGYDGTQEATSLAPLPPVGYANRYAPTEQVNTVRFAGSYYLVVHLAQEVADGFGEGPFALTLRVRVSGAAQAGPDYVGEPEPRGLFDVTEEDREAAAEGGTADDDLAMTALAASGIGTGSALLVGLGVWTAVARRRAVG
ncbi:hypothetical protein [Streptomyces sp. DH24]|uniref:hypothetical protein n=1 Tax=Streptomyces sp. DH24 TaxID=3040123 RepID=UPI0024419435|nr:hypothetical protein [Streptomyces sp. DH24]MDG9718634.1 hypothetical protein [Streptomyces sp. DH24]